MKELEKAMKIAQDAFDKALFEAAVDELVVENNKKETKKPSRLEELETILSKIDESSLFGDLYDDFKAYEIMMLFEEEDELLDNELFVNPNKESRRRTRKENRKHKTYDVYGHSYKRYGKDKQVGKQYREERLYNSGFKTKRTTVPMYEYDNDTEIPALADVDKGEYRSINGYAYPKQYITEEEQELFYKAKLWEQRGRTNTGMILYLSFSVCRTDDGRGKITALVWAEENLLYEGEDIEKAKEIFNVLNI